MNKYLVKKDGKIVGEIEVMGKYDALNQLGEITNDVFWGNSAPIPAIIESNPGQLKCFVGYVYDVEMIED